METPLPMLMDSDASANDTQILVDNDTSGNDTQILVDSDTAGDGTQEVERTVQFADMPSNQEHSHAGHRERDDLKSH